MDHGTAVSADTALAILESASEDLPEILAAANAVRLRNFGNRVELCSIVNAKSGRCGEDCAFCAQSAHHQCPSEVYELLDRDEIVRARDAAAANPIDYFGVVTSGGALGGEGLSQIGDTVATGPANGVAWCASLGCLAEPQLCELKAKGLKRFHHNLETAESFFPQICTTHSYAERLATVRAVKAAGLEICCGGLLGLGESLEQRVEFAQTLAGENVDSIPLNFLVPVPGTRLEKQSPLSPMEMLRTIAMFRLTNPGAGLKIAAGRLHLRDLQALIFSAGATGMMVGDLLTVAGGDVPRDLQMLQDLEIEIATQG
jgi:biotin synthase